MAEHPAAPAPPVVTTGADVRTFGDHDFWRSTGSHPQNTGEAINDYDYRYKKTTDTTWTTVDRYVDASDDDTDDAISSLEADTAYQVSIARGKRLRATVHGRFAAVGSTNKEGNAAPEFAGH